MQQSSIYLMYIYICISGGTRSATRICASHGVLSQAAPKALEALKRAEAEADEVKQEGERWS